jgi:ABC-2 type transport system permease protein
MNKALFIANIKSTYKIWIIFFLILLMYNSITLSMFDPDSTEEMQALYDMMPEAMMKAFGFSIFDPTLLGHMASFFYGFIIILFPLIYTIMLSYKLVAKYVDSGSMAFLLSSPNTRGKVIITQIITLLSSIILLLLSVIAVGVTFSIILFSGLLDIGGYLLLNLGAILLYFAISGITFLCSTYFNEGKNALMFGIGIPVGFFLVNMLRNVDEQLDFLRFFTIYTLYDNQLILQNSSIIWFHFLALFAIGVICYLLSIKIFKTKDLTL